MKKVRAEFRKNRLSKTRKTDVTREFHQETLDEDQAVRAERISGKGSMTRQRTIQLDKDSDGQIAVAEDARPGLVIRVHGLNTFVEDDASGKIYVCAVGESESAVSAMRDKIINDGTTLLGADDKAGVAEIMEMLSYFQEIQ